MPCQRRVGGVGVSHSSGGWWRSHKYLSRRLVGWRSSPSFPSIAAREMNAWRPTQRRRRAARLSFITLADEPSGRLKINVTEGDAGQTLQGWPDWACASQGEVEGSGGRCRTGSSKTSAPSLFFLQSDPEGQGLFPLNSFF